MNLYNTHRPASLEDIIGNESVVAALESLLENEGDTPHSFLFTGPSGTGKTTLARIMAREFGAEVLDLIEVDSADFRGIDTIRGIRKQIGLMPVQGKSRAWIMDECHQISVDGMHALLKALEDTPDHVYFFLCTTHPDKLLPTIRNRCTRFDLTALGEDDMTRLLRKVTRAEGSKLPKSALESIYDHSEGSPRKALVALEKVLAVEDADVEKVLKELNHEGSEGVIELCRMLLSGAKWKTVAKLLGGIKEEPESVRRAVLGYFEKVLRNGGDPKAYLVLDTFREPFYNTGRAGLVLACYEVIEGGE